VLLFLEERAEDQEIFDARSGEPKHQEDLVGEDHHPPIGTTLRDQLHQESSRFVETGVQYEGKPVSSVEGAWFYLLQGLENVLERLCQQGTVIDGLHLFKEDQDEAKADLDAGSRSL